MSRRTRPSPPPGQVPATSAPARRSRPWTGALAITLALAALGALVLMISPAARNQFQLSSHRRTAPYVELYFVDQVTARACERSGDHTDVQAAVLSHLDSSAAVSWTVSTVRADGKPVQTVTGSLATEPGFASEISAGLAVPRTQAYTLAVSLPAQNQSVFVHCGTST